jgi:hypothetical protein
MASCGLLRCVALVKTDVSEELNAYIIRMARIGELGTLAVTSNRRKLRSVRELLVTANVPSSPILVTLMMEALSSSETSVLTRATRSLSRNEFSALEITGLRVALSEGPSSLHCLVLHLKTETDPVSGTSCFLVI